MNMFICIHEAHILFRCGYICTQGYISYKQSMGLLGLVTLPFIDQKFSNDGTMKCGKFDQWGTFDHLLATNLLAWK